MAQPIPGVQWFDIADPSLRELDDLAARFHLHELEIEDCRHRPQRAKLQEHADYQFCVAKKMQATRSFEDFDIFLGRDFIISVHIGCSDIVERVRERAVAEQNAGGRVDRLFYMMLDEIVDDYLPILDRVAEETNDIENDVLEHPEPSMLRRIFELKRSLISFRRNAGGMREVVNAVIRREHGIVSDDLDTYFRDVYDHLIRTVDLIESYRDLLSGSLDIYLSAVANRTNEVMKVLTVWGTVALPMVIITGFFGMNLPLPWQNNPHGLWYTVALMAAWTAGILAYFRRKGWF